MQFSNEVVIRRSPAEVFAYLADFENIPIWNYAITATRKVTPGPVAVGTTYRQTRSIPRVAEETFAVTALDPDGGIVAVTGDLGPFTGTLTYRLTPVPTGTMLVNEVQLRGRGALGLLGGIAGGRVQAAVAENLDVLRRELERDLG